jgi:hypothetical protein
VVDAMPLRSLLHLQIDAQNERGWGGLPIMKSGNPTSVFAATAYCLLGVAIPNISSSSHPSQGPVQPQSAWWQMPVVICLTGTQLPQCMKACKLSDKTLCAHSDRLLDRLLDEAAIR